ncbi:protein THEM6 [Protopterus annectens]|uniref:protein THEM6 n=1 Tax=Protopterus annectens TaxID=7888 RepID=UPI001CFA0FDC|nr:protein THEM6 [Protopterus annectens]
MLLILLPCLCVLFAFFDVWYFIRSVLVVLLAHMKPKVKDILAEQSLGGIVFFNDLDFMGHMNNARYLRELDFARVSLYAANGIMHALRRLNGSVVLGASTIRYRRSLELFERYDIKTKIISWDEKAFYVEQRFVSCRDGFICAVMLCRQNILRSTPGKVLQFLCKRTVDPPDYPAELQHWLNYNETSSLKLRGVDHASNDVKLQ